MTTATEVLTYLRENFTTSGKLQRQKLLYYIQAWNLAWNGEKLFDDAVTAWEMGPVVVPAWRADVNGTTQPTPAKTPVNLSDDARATIKAVVDFYGRFSGGLLRDRTHEELPWQNAYENVSPIMRGSFEIRPAAMRSFYALQAVEGCQRPVKPATSHRLISDEELQRLVGAELPRWGGVLTLLAER